METGKENKLVQIVTAMPCSGTIHPLAAKAYFTEQTETSEGKMIVRLDPNVCSNLADGFNRALCFALNLRDQGLADLFAMQHSDIQPSKNYVDTLYKEMVRTGAHWISAASPIKDGHGVTSTAVGCDNRWNPYARITLQELHQLPETFCIDDLGPAAKELGYSLLLNTGCMLLDLRHDYWRQVKDRGELEPHFEISNRIVYVPGSGWQAQTETEDWQLSRILASYGAKLVCTRKVTVRHYGTLPFSSAMPWGDWSQDQVGERVAIQKLQTPQATINEHGYWEGWPEDSNLRDASLIAGVVSVCKQVGGSVSDLGCGRGWFTDALNKAGVAVIGYDGNPATEELDSSLYCRADLTQPFFDTGDITLCLEVGEHIPEQYQEQFLDNVANSAKKLVILSWALPNQPGCGHVNCRDNAWVRDQMEKRGFFTNTVLETMLRASVQTLDYFRNTIMVFDREPGALVASSTKAEEQPKPTCRCDCRKSKQGAFVPKSATTLSPQQVVKYSDLVDATLALVPKLPPTLSGVVGVPRKGMLPATILATTLHVKLGSVRRSEDGDSAALDWLDTGKRVPLYTPARDAESPKQEILIVDDAVGNGFELERIVSALCRTYPKHKFYTAVALATKEGLGTSEHVVDFTAGVFSQGQFQQAEFLNTFSAPSYMVDLDGVVCNDPHRIERDGDETFWQEYFQEWATPLYLPRLEPVSAIVTSRLETYRAATEQWLRRWGVKYDRLVMWPGTSVRERDVCLSNHVKHKMEVFNAEPYALVFIESCKLQAELMVRNTNKLIFCTETGLLQQGLRAPVPVEV